jgi:hypothetical protein
LVEINAILASFKGEIPMKTLTDSSPGAPSWLSLIQQQVGTLSYGVVQIVVHDGHVVQIERTEKIRFEKPGEKKASGI